MYGCREELEAAQAKHQRTLQKCDLLDRGIAGKRPKMAEREASYARMQEASFSSIPLHLPRLGLLPQRKHKACFIRHSVPLGSPQRLA